MSSGKGGGSIWGTIIGGVLGIVAAYFTGPGGYYGYMMGYAIGSAIGGVAGYLIDPPSMAPDSSAIGAPKTQELMGTTAQDGLIVPDLFGITKCGGNLLGYWGNRAVEVIEAAETEGGKGGEDAPAGYVTGHNYYLTWAMGLCLGPVDELLAIWRKEECVWHGNLLRPETEGVRTVVIDGVGRIYFYYGTDDQVRDTQLNDMVGTANNPAYRGLCYVVFVDCLMGNYNRLPEFWFVIRKRPEFGWSALQDVGDNYNPAHALYYTLTEMAGVDTSLINESAFAAAAETLSDEGRGLSCYFDRQTSAGSYVDTILTHMRGLLRYGADGLFHLVLIRRDTSGTVPVLNADELASGLKLSRPSAVEVKNEVKIQFAELVWTGATVFELRFTEFGDYQIIPAYAIDVYTIPLGEWIIAGPCAVSFGAPNNTLKLWNPGSGAYSEDIVMYRRCGAGLEEKFSISFDLQRPASVSGDWEWSLTIWTGELAFYVGGNADVYFTFDGAPGGGFVGFGESETDGDMHAIKFTCNKLTRTADIYVDGKLAAAGMECLFDYGLAYNDDEFLMAWTWQGWPDEWLRVDDLRLTNDTIANFTDQLIVVRDEASQRALGKVCQTTLKAGMFNCIPDAVWMAEGLLRSAIYPAAQVIIQGRRELMRFETGDPFDLTYTPYGLSLRRFRVTGIEEADLSSEAVTLHAVEDTDELTSEYVRPDVLLLDVIPPDADLPPLTHILVTEPPYVPGLYEGATNLLSVAAARETGLETGFTASFSADGDSYAGVGTQFVMAVWGELTAAYPAATYKIDDTVGVLVSITTGADRIETIGRGLALAGFNLAIIDSEIISFESITPTANDDEYQLLGVVRGLFDTEPADHAVDADFYWLGQGEALLRRASAIVQLGGTPYVKAVPRTSAASGSITDALAYQPEGSITERALCPYPPANLMANDMAVNARYATDVALSWRTLIRGTGAGIGDPDFVVDEAPAWEGTFTVAVIVGAVTVRTTAGIDDDSWTYTEAMNLSDNGTLANEVTFQVRGDLDVNHHSGWAEIVVKKE